MIATSSEQVAENIRRLVESLAREISHRVANDPKNSDATPYNVELHAKLVLLGWFLGDLVPGQD
jgi:hypothetical protein